MFKSIWAKVTAVFGILAGVLYVAYRVMANRAATAESKLETANTDKKDAVLEERQSGLKAAQTTLAEEHEKEKATVQSKEELESWLKKNI